METELWEVLSALFLNRNRVRIHLVEITMNIFMEGLWTSEKRLVNASQACKPNTKKLDTNFSNKNVSSNFSATLNSIPNKRSFKMAFLNIVSLPGKIDEIRHSMSSKNIDLITFNEHD